MQIKFLPNPSYCHQLHLHRSAVKMTSVSGTTHTGTRTLRYKLRSREIYIKEPITYPEMLSEKPQTRDESITTIQETPNSQFRLVLSVTPCMPCISSLESVNDSTSPLLFSSTSSLTFALPLTPLRISYLPLPLAPLISKLLLTHVLTLAPIMIKPNHLNYSAPALQIKTSGHHLHPSLNVPTN